MSVGEITHQQKSVMTDNMRKCQTAGSFPARFCVGECVEPARTERGFISPPERNNRWHSIVKLFCYEKSREILNRLTMGGLKRIEGVSSDANGSDIP